MKRLLIILFLMLSFVTSTLGDVYTSHQLPHTNDTLDVGSDELFWHFFYGTAFTDGTAYWESNQLYGFDEIVGTTIIGDTLTDGVLSINAGSITSAVDGTFSGTLTGDTITDGTFVVSGGEISAGEIIATFGDIDIGGNTLTSWAIDTGQIIAHSTSDPQLLLRHTTGVDEAGFYVDSFGDLTITPTRNIIFQPATDSTTFFQIKNAAGTVIPLIVNTTNGIINLKANPIIQAAGTQIIKFDDTNFNVLLGTEAFDNDEGQGNTGCGYEAGYYNNHTAGNEGYFNTYYGYQAGRGGRLGTKNTGYANNYVGYLAGYGNYDGFQNNFMGASAGYSNTSGYENNFIGPSTGYSNTSGYRNNFMGYQAGYSNIGGYQNNFIGYHSGWSNTTGYSNIYFGPYSGYNQTINNNLLIIDNQDRGSAAFELTDALIYGVFNATPASQTLRFNVGATTWHNATHEDSDGGRLNQFNFKGQQSGGEETTLARIEVGHDGIVDDEKGYLDIFINDGDDVDAPTHMVRVDSLGVGIGTTTPAYPLDVDGIARIVGDFYCDNDVFLLTPATGIHGPSDDDSYFRFTARDNGNAGIEVARCQGAADPYFKAGSAVFLESGNVGIGEVAPTARLHLAAGTATASTAPLKFTPGTHLTVPEAGVFEFDGHGLHFTEVVDRRIVSLASDSIVAPTSLSNNVAEVVIYTATISAAELIANKVLLVRCFGKITVDDGANKVTLRIKLGTVTLGTIISTPKIVTDEPWHMKSFITMRTIGAGGTVSSHSDMLIEDTHLHEHISSQAINTTVANNITVTADWTTADASDIITIDQGFMEVLN